MKKYQLTKKGQAQTSLYFAGRTLVIADITDDEIDEVWDFGGKVYFEKIETPTPGPTKQLEKQKAE